MRILTFADGITTATAPTASGAAAVELQNFANDAAFEAAYNVGDGSIYYNTTDDTIRAYFDGSWRELAVFE